MAEFPGDLYFAESHEWARIEDDGTITVGISDHAQDSLGDVVFVELPEVDATVEAGGEAGVVESVKAASDIYAPVSGTITAVNTALEDAPETVNESPYDNGWFFKMKPDNLDDVKAMMNAEAYESFCENEDH
ncbi:MAG: glycine cleavage system protein GcvH [Pseudomonadales bacterium]|nr:glycine cleavage system protein GcvH [Pseudomonadales bacterium]